MKKKLFTLMTLLLCICSGAWAQLTNPTLDVEFTSSTTSSWLKEYDCGVTLSGDGGFSSSSGYYYGGCSGRGSLNSKYLGISCPSNKKIVGVAIKATTSTSNTNINPVFVGWSDTPTATSVACYTNKALTSYSSTAKTAAEWLTYDLSAETNEIKYIQIYRQLNKNTFKVSGSDTYIGGGEHYGTSEKTPRIWMVQVKLADAAPQTSPTITTHPSNGVFQKDATGKTITAAATPSAGSCSYEWFKCDDANKTNPVSQGSSSTSNSSFSVPTSTAGTFYYFCRVSDGGSNKTDTEVATVVIVDREAKQTWDFTTISVDDIKYNSDSYFSTAFYTYKGNSTYYHSFDKATYGSLQDNYGNDLLNGIQVYRSAGNASVYVYCDATNSRYGINLQGASDKPGLWKIPVENGKCYKVTYTTNTNSKTLGYIIGGDASAIDGEANREHTFSTAFSETDDFVVVATADGYMTLTNRGTDANNCTLVKIEEVTSYTVTYALNGGTGTTPTEANKVSGQTFTLHDGETDITAPDGKEFSKWKDQDDNEYAGSAEFTMPAKNVTLTAQWVEGAVKYDVTKGLHTNGDFTITPSTAAEGATVDISAEGNTGYEFSSWNIYKTGEPATTISPAAATASTTFTMPAYAVTVDATFAAKTYTVTLNNQSATTAGTESVTTTYNANTNLTTNITCPAKTDYVFMGYYTAADGEGKRLIDNSGAWIASVDGYTDASKNWVKDGGVTLYACWMKYATSADFNVFAYANISRGGTSSSKTPLDDNNFSYNLNGDSKLDYSTDVRYVGLKTKTKDDYVKFAVQAGKQVTVIFGYVKTTVPTLSIDGGAETDIDITKQSDNQIVYYASAATDRLFKIKASDKDAMVIKKIFIEDASTTSVTATVGANGYTTFTSPYALDLTNANRPAGLKAYKATLDGANLTFAELNQVVPAGTGLLLLGETKGGNYDIPVVAGAGTAAANNALIGITAITPMKSTADNDYFFVMKKASAANDPLKFAPLTTGSTAVNVPAGKVVVEVPNSAFTGARELTFSFSAGETTGISNVDINANDNFDANAPMYNLAGQKVSKSYKGIVIVNGKKVVRK